MRKRFVAGNWKMHTTIQDGVQLAKEITTAVGNNESVDVAIIPPFTHLATIQEIVKNSSVKLGAQNVAEFERGAYTGEVSAEMLQSVGTQYVLVGHSERRSILGESNEVLKNKMDLLLQYHFSPIFCIGESLEERESNQHFAVIEKQLTESLFHLSAEALKNVTIAYEPVWAIGTGKTASPEQAQEMHAFIRALLAQKYTEELAENTRILYGGSVKPNNAAELFSQKDIDGGLIGGAALQANDFMGIINA